MAIIKEKGAPRDKDKLVRQLSLVAYLMAMKGRKIDAETIRWRVEGYNDGDRSQETFARRFFADRADLKELGIEINSERDGFGDGDVYWLPPENFFLPPVSFSHEELAALHTCLYLLEGQFAWSHLLRLALQSLALGTGNALDDPATGCVTIDLPSSGFDDRIAKSQTKIEEAIINRKTIRFSYHSFGSDAVEERRVDPFSMMYTGGGWYVVGFAHERGAIRMFKLKRIRGRITSATKKDHDFKVPPDFRAQDFVNLQPWQLGRERGVATITFSPLYGWWAGNNLAASGEMETRPDGSAILRTGYADGAQLCSLVLARSAHSHVDGPPELKLQMAAILEKIVEQHSGAAPESAPPAQSQPERQAHAGSPHSQSPQIEPDRFSQLAKTVSYLVEKLGEEEFITLPADEVCHDLGLDRRELGQAMAALYLVSADCGGYLVNGSLDGDSLRVEGFPHGELLKRPARLTPREARAMLLAIDLVGNQTLAGLYPSLESAREKIIAAAGGLSETGAIPVGENEKEDFQICQAINQGLSAHKLVEIEYLSRDQGRIETRRIEPCLVNGAKGQWYLVAWCRERDAVRTFRFEMIKSARILDESFEPRDIDLSPFRANPSLPSGKEAPGIARVLFRPAVARWVYEKHPEATMLADGSLLAEIRYFQEDWLIDEVLSYCGEAVLAAPAELREKVRSAARRLQARYG